MAEESLADILAAPAPARIVDAIARMRAIERALPPADGVAWFTRLYLRVTERVNERAGRRGFRAPRFIRWLDVVFANLFFAALRSHFLATGPLPKAWAPLIDGRARPGVAPIQFALAGMNAHINRDLPLALVETWQALDLEPRRGGGEYADFVRVNDLLAEVEEEFKESFSTGLLAEVDVALGRVDDVVAIWKVANAREAAWVNGETLWALRGAPELRREFVRTLDRMVGFAGRGLLRPLAVPVSG